ncbi:hypothetical protein [Neolewinella litorea]|uniref:Uncharacterized protein n=1 Tax=Neolewinella litorea TaxID=2562452 RepID=A0A4V3XKQ4_9BACT|nr:hypothetical protein [Neolewinella litorea]THH37903.1 hypothetical protein E4021_12760 [Neolewinella litorea]
MKYLSLFLFAAFLTACGDTSEATVDDTVETPETTMEPSDPAGTLQATVEAVQANGGDITALPGEAAVANIDTWTEQLEGVNGAEKVTSNLESLRETLSESPINGQLAGMQLISLAEDTRQVAGSTPGISALVAALQAGGEKLTASAFAGESLLDQTLQAGKSAAADITTLPANAAIGNVDGWIAELRGMDGTDEIVGDLEALKQELSAPTIDGAKTSDLLFSLAESTRSLADGSPGLATLAYLLESGAWRLQGISESK